MKRIWIDSFQQWDPSIVLSVVGPTGSGKTSGLLDHLRAHPQLRNALLVSTDAVAVYKNLNIGSAKPLGADRSDFEWVGLDLFDPQQASNIADYLSAVEPFIANAIQQGRPVVLVGGSGFYERALVQGRSPGAASDPSFLQSLKSRANQELYQDLVSHDPRWSQKLHSNDRYRLERYSDLVFRQGLSFNELFESLLRPAVLAERWSLTQSLALNLDKPREWYAERLLFRINQMLDDGWIQETQSILDGGCPSESPGLKSVGYRQICEYLQSQISLDSLKAQILQEHLWLVKKQKTWFRGLRDLSL